MEIKSNQPSKRVKVERPLAAKSGSTCRLQNLVGNLKIREKIR